MHGHRRGPWSANEDQMLVSLVKTHGAHNWVRISALIGSRTPKQCRERFHQNLKPSLNHDPITPEEGAVIERLVAEMGKRWAEIARRLNGRSDNAVKNWWNGGMNRRRRMIGRQRNTQNSRTVNHSNDMTPSPLSSPSLQPAGLHIYTHGKSDDAMVSPTYSHFSGYSRGQTPSLISDTASSLSGCSPRVPASPACENTLPPLLNLHGQERHSMSTLFPSPEGYDATRYSHHQTLFLEKEQLRLPHFVDGLPKPAFSQPVEPRTDKMSVSFLLD